MLPVANPQALEANPQLAELTLNVVKQVATRQAEIVPIGAAPLDTQPRVYTPSAGGTQWTITRIEDDPLTARGNIPIPAAQRRNLKNIHKAGIEFAELFIAHELPDRSFPNKPDGWNHLTDLELAWLHQHAQAPINQQTLQLSDRIGGQIEVAARNTGRGARYGLSMLNRNKRGIATFTAATAATALATLATLDPVIIGAVTISGQPTPGEPASWIILARWEW